MENASTGQMRSSNPPPACGAGCARVRRSRFGVWPHGKAHSAQPVGSKCAFPSQRDRRMRLSVECVFPHLGKRGVTSRKSAFCNRDATEKRILVRRLTEKRILTVRETAECVFPSRCGAREVWGNPPPGCGALWRMPQLGKCARATPRQPAGRVARGSADLGSESGLTERRTLPDRRVPNCAFPSQRDRKMRLSVECAFPYLRKRGVASRKSAVCLRRPTQTVFP